MILSMAREGHFKEEQYDEDGRALNPVSDAKLLELIAQHVSINYPRTQAGRKHGRSNSLPLHARAHTQLLAPLSYFYACLLCRLQVCRPRKLP